MKAPPLCGILALYFLYKGDDSVTNLRDKRLFLLDMDGTLYIGDRLFDGVPEFLQIGRAHV